jgi:branched-chain amino acid transport system substrate-binding protein
MKTRNVIGLVLFVVLTFGFFTFFGQLQAAEEFKFGVCAPISGAGSTYGIPQVNGIKMAVEEINAKGGITVAGKKYILTPIIYDDKCVPSEGVTVFEKLVNSDKVKIILGPICSGNVMAIAPKVGDKVILMTIGSIVTGYTELGNPYIFRPHTSAKNINKGTVIFLTKDLDIRNLGIIASKNPVSFEQIQAIEEAFKKEGRNLSIEYCDLQTTNLYSQITSLTAKKLDAFAFCGYPDQAALTLKQMNELGFNPKYRLSLASGTVDEYLRIVSAEVLEGCYEVSSPTIDVWIQSGSTKALEFYKRFKEKFGIGPSGPAGCNSYDVVYIIAKGLENAGTITDLVKMRTALQNIGKIEQTVIDYPIVNGKMFNEKNEVYFGASIRQFRNREFKFIKFMDIQ